jgi:MFS family permease
MAVLALLVIVVSIVIIIAAGGHETAASAIAICAIVLAIMVLFGGVMVAIANKPEAVITERLRKSMTEDQWEALQNHKVARRGWWVAGISLLAVILATLSGSWEVRTLGGIFAGGGALVGMIFVFAYSPKGGPVDDRHEGIARMLAFTGMIVMMFALGAAIARPFWPLVLVVGSLSAFQLWAMFWGSRSGPLLGLRALVQLGLIATIFYAASSHGLHNR